MPNQTTFTIKLETELKDAFTKIAETEHCSVSQVMRDLMQQYIERHEYKHFLEDKVTSARASIANGQSIPHQDAKAIFKTRREKV
ncbi:ribbon-helix-helix protein, CopG family [Budviciaceae bacterium BWR-B9]|uniref:Ribbon-helix-helix protein, CopG family n=1 Tax=Limnobaculum allomyrinae TaxID=2791986 RepID=A0ABS1IS16_9GAMM|nr:MULTISPECIES: ribbon-helix-helix protein, CopG family [Limnobaculum]MBK5144551.1 ribbon-helix-helix protein, CopG family [Limnobaculum allomyrinae]MBV7692220.1 ribbon-helix-helix protein, CopG family [Limnobaculum sp. M2-1]